VVRDGEVLGEAVYREERSHTRSLTQLVERVLADAGLTITAVDALAVSIGPGSFTGLRVGLSLAKGIAFAGGLPIAAVPTLEALAWSAEAEPGETICAALDARKREVYAALFTMTASGPRRDTPDEALAPAALAARLRPGCILVGDAGDAYGAVLGERAVLRPFATHHPRGGVVARLGWRRLCDGAVEPIGPLEPVYVRPPDAELPRTGSR
jgi:tRNA threonylcarbamoyladenosine biosynthesis protein TsaB